MARIVTIFGEIDESVEKAVKEILDWNAEDDEADAEYKDFEREPIRLYINSRGGYCLEGFAIIDVMMTSKTPIHTYCIGAAMSMGLNIFLAGHKRFSGKNAAFMYHAAQGCAAEGMAERGFSSIKELDRQDKQAMEFITTRCRIKMDQLRDARRDGNMWFFTPKEALKLGVCHEILTEQHVEKLNNKKKGKK